MFYQISFSPQVKRSANISNKHGIYELLHESPNDVGMRKYEENALTPQNDSAAAIPPTKMKISLKLAKTLEKQKFNSSRSALGHTKIRVSLKYLHQ